MNINCIIKEKYGMTKYAYYIMKNFKNAHIFLDFRHKFYGTEIFLENVELKSENMLNFFRDIANYNFNTYLILLSSLNEDYLLNLYSNLHDVGKKIIKNKKSGEVEAIFYLASSTSKVIIDNGKSKLIFEFRIEAAVISKDFLMKLVKDFRFSYKEGAELPEIIDRFISFLEKEQRRFFLIPYKMTGEYALKLRLHYFHGPSIKFIIEAPRVSLDNYASHVIPSVIKKDAKEKEAGFLLRKVLESIIYDNDDVNWARKTNIEKLISWIFTNLLICYLNDEENHVFEIEPSSDDTLITIILSTDLLENKARKNDFFASFWKVLLEMYTMPKGYHNEEIFDGDLILIKKTLVKNDWEDAHLVIHCLVKVTENYENLLVIEAKKHYYDRDIIIRIVLYKKQFNENFYIKNENFDAIINDIAKALVKFGIIYHADEFRFLIKYAKIFQMNNLMKLQ